MHKLLVVVAVVFVFILVVVAVHFGFAFAAASSDSWRFPLKQKGSLLLTEIDDLYTCNLHVGR